MIINKLQGEPEDSDLKLSYTNKADSGTNKVFPSEDDKYGVNILSLSLSNDFSFFKKIAEATGEELDLFDSEEELIIKQIEAKKKDSKGFEATKNFEFKNHSKNASKIPERKYSTSEEVYSDKSTNSFTRENKDLSNSLEEHSTETNFNFLNLNSKHESISIITDRIIHEVYLDLSLNTNPFVDYILYERQINKMMNKEKELVPTLVKSLLHSFSLLIKDRASKIPNFEKLKSQKKDQDGNYLFNLNDYKIVIDIHWFYEIIQRLIRQIKEIFEAPLNILNKICKINFDFESVFKEIFFNLVNYKEIACLLTYAEYKISAPDIINQIVKKFSEESTKLIKLNQFKKLSELLYLDDISSGYSYVEFISNIRKTIADAGNEKISDLKISVDEQERKNKNYGINVTVEKKEKEIAPKKNHQYKSIDELYNFIVSDENVSLVNDDHNLNNFLNKTDNKSDFFNFSDKNSIKKKIIKKKTTKKKISTGPNTTSKICEILQQSPSNYILNDPEVDNFKKILAFQSINANAIKKIKPILKKEWLSATTN